MELKLELISPCRYHGVLDIRDVVLYQLLQKFSVPEGAEGDTDLPILSNMVIMERLCPAIGANPVPRVKDYS